MRISSYLRKLIALTLLVGTFPVLTLGWYSYHHSSQSVLAQVEERNAQVLRQSQLRVEQTLRMIDYSTSQILSVPAVAQAFSLPLGMPERERIKEIYNMLAAIQTYELGIKDVYLLSLEREWIITNAGIGDYSLPGLREKLLGYAGIPQGSVWINGNSTQVQGPEGPVELAHAVMSVKKWPINSVNPRGLICVVLPAQQLLGLIDSDPGAGTIFILDRDGRVVAHPDSAKRDMPLGELSYVQELNRSGTDIGIVNGKDEDGERISVSYRKSGYNGWTYISVVPTKAITRQAAAISWTSVLVSVAVLAATIIAALAGSRKMYRPVRTIYASLLQDHAGRVPGDELNVISATIQGILSDRSKLKVELQDQRQQLVELLVRKLMLGEAKPSGVAEQLSDYGYGYTGRWTAMRVLLLKIDRLEHGRFAEKDSDLLLFAIANIAAELAPPERGLPPVIMDESVVLLAGTEAGGESAFKEDVFAWSSRIQEAVKRYLRLQTSFGVSRPFRRWDEAEDGYREGDVALKYRTRLGEEAILFLEDVQPEKGKEFLYPKERSERLLEAVRDQDETRAYAELASLMAALSAQDCEYGDFQMALVRLLTDLLRLLQDAGISPRQLHLDGDSPFGELLKLHAARDIESWFRDTIVSPGIALLEERRRAQFTTISQAVKELIEEAFDSDLTLEKCAARLNYHPQYISRVFRQETGINFADYLAGYRLEVAKRWLRDSELKVSDIAERLKYNNSANFIRYFRKMEGMTPGQYRTENRRV